MFHRATLLFLVAATGCSNMGRDGGDGSANADAGCVEGAHRCEGPSWTLCQNGESIPDQTCTTDQVCSDDKGCVPCLPGHTACKGDQIVRCNENGYPSDTVVGDCQGLSCAVDPATREAVCVTPCDPKALAKTYTGCVYYAVDLPNWSQDTPLGIGSIASDQPFAVAVANPQPVSLDVVVERNVATVGSPPQLEQVLARTVPAGGLTVLPLPQREVSGYASGKHRNTSLLSARAYRITTSRPASIYQFNPQNNPDSYSNDASLLIPQNALDANYVVLGWPGYGGDVVFGNMTIKSDKRPFITIVGTKPNTKVRVTPSTEIMPGDNTMAMHPGKSYTFTLGEFETLNLEGADGMQYGETDFTGTRIEADGPLAVWSGVECITINPPMSMSGCCCDHLEEQLFPRSSLGPDYVVVHHEARDHQTVDPEFFRILALEDGTDVETSLPAPNDHFLLDAGKMREIIASDDFRVHANKALEVGQFQVSQDSSASGQGDPSFELVPPVAQHRPKYIFLVPSGYGDNWLLISIPEGGMLTLDGKPAAGCNRAPAGTVGMTAYEAVRCPVTEGAHTIESMAKFGMIIVGWGPGPVSYGYTAGMEFQSVNHDCDKDGDCPPAEFCSGGWCAPIIQ